MPVQKALICVLLLGWLAAACIPQTQVPSTSTAGSPSGITAAPTQEPSPAATGTVALQPSPTPSGIWVSLVPGSGKPGDTIRIEGYLPGGPTQQSTQNEQSMGQITVCWQGCLTGLTEQGLAVKWSASQAGHFSTQFRVPDQPWLSNTGPEPLQPGDYTVGVQCLGGKGGCATEQAQASATFQLEGPTPKTCQAGQPCTDLSFTPDQAPPGTEIQVQGWAPLVSIIGNEEALGYELVLTPTSSSEAPVTLGQIQQALDGPSRAPLSSPSKNLAWAHWCQGPTDWPCLLSAPRPTQTTTHRWWPKRLSRSPER